MKRIIFLAAMLLASCNREEQPEAPTAAESERLNDAEAMLNELAREEGSAPKGTPPSQDRR
jgi:hypothetical protein